MPEILAVVAVVVVSFIAWIGAWLHARDPANFVTGDELVRLRQQSSWLRERLERAERERWSDDLRAGLADEWRITTEQLAALEGRAELVTAK